MAWPGDATGLAKAIGAGKLTAADAFEGSLAAIERSTLNAFCFVDAAGARERARAIDKERKSKRRDHGPFQGVPIGIKELEDVAGWPATEASVPLANERAAADSVQVSRLRQGGGVIVGLTTSPEFGGVNYTHSKLHGTTRNPWDQSRTPGGSSGGSAAAVAGGLVPIASGSDGGGSIRIPAGFCGLVGLKPTYGLIPRGPGVKQNPLTTAVGCLARSVRDTAHWLEQCRGFDPRDTLSHPSDGAGPYVTSPKHLRKLRAAISIDLGVAIVEPRQIELLTQLAEWVIEAADLKRVDVDVRLRLAGFEWTLGNSVNLFASLGDRYPDCIDELTPEIRSSVRFAERRFNPTTAAAAEQFRVEINEAAADLFERVDLVFAATNPDVAFDAAGPMRRTVGDRDLAAEFSPARAVANNGALTIPANLTGQPAISIPAGTIDGLPVGLQVIARHHHEAELLQVARLIETERGWPLTAPGVEEGPSTGKDSGR